MALLFVGGIMNLFWVAGLSVFIPVKKITRRSEAALAKQWAAF